MTPIQILKDVLDQYSEYLEMMEADEKFILISNALAQKLSMEIAEKDHYKTCFEASLGMKKRINS